MDKVVHFEIPAQDLARAQKFYKDNFGWEIQKVPTPGPEYYIAKTVEVDDKEMPISPGAINGAIAEKNDGIPYPIIVIKVRSLDGSLAKIEASGGKIVMPKMQVMDMGLYARFKDPEGNIIGIWQDLK